MPIDVKIKLYEEEIKISVNDEETILDALLEKGYEPPFSCQVGVCGTCIAKLETGKVKMDEDIALDEEEIKNGMILTCQSHPITNNCFINYDI